VVVVGSLQGLPWAGVCKIYKKYLSITDEDHCIFHSGPHPRVGVGVGRLFLYL
jgi:hypothetical protein